MGDALGSVNQMIRQDQTIANSTLTNAWGEDLQFVQATGDRHGFTQRERDSESGVMHYRARFYDPRIGRFGGKDPLQENRTLEHFLYTGNNPPISIDPSGKQLEINVGQRKRKTTLHLNKEQFKRYKDEGVVYLGEDRLPPEAVVETGKVEFGQHAFEFDPNAADLVLRTSQSIASGENDLLPLDLEELYQGLKERVMKTGKKISKLNFYGHGGRSTLPIGEESMTVDALAGLVERHPDILDFFDRGAHVVSYACWTGADRDFLRAIGTAFLSKSGGKVEGYTGELVYGRIGVFFGHGVREGGGVPLLSPFIDSVFNSHYWARVTITGIASVEPKDVIAKIRSITTTPTPKSIEYTEAVPEHTRKVPSNESRPK
jgi:RHS repeat-associated protein